MNSKPNVYQRVALAMTQAETSCYVLHRLFNCYVMNSKRLFCTTVTKTRILVNGTDWRCREQTIWLHV